MKYRIYALALFIICGCTNYGSADVCLVKNENQSLALSGEVLNLPDIDAPSRIYWSDSLLLFKDNASKRAQLFVHDLRTGKTNHFIKQGRGPGELLGVFYVAFIRDTTLVWDITQGKVLSAVTDSLKHGSYYPKTCWSSDVSWQKVSCITGFGSQVIGLGSKDCKRVVRVHNRDGIIPVFSYNPDLAEKYEADIVLKAYEGVIKANEKKNACVVACRYADQLEIVNFDTGKPVFVKGPELFEPQSEVVTVRGGNTLSHPADEKKGYIDVCCDDELIYALYSGREMKERNSSFGRILRVFSWDGEYVATYNFDRDILAIDIDSHNDMVYAISSLHDIVRYAL